MNDQLDAILKSLGIISLNARQLFIEAAEVKEWKKSKDIFVAGKTNSSEYILISGMAHRYNFSEDSAMVTTGFYGPAAVITPHFARMHKGEIAVVKPLGATFCVLVKLLELYENDILISWESRNEE